MNNFDESSYVEDDAELWHVQLPTGEVRAMTLDELDAAFQNGRVHAGTYVFEEKTNQWATLGEVAGLDMDEPAASYFPPTGYGQLGAGPNGYPLTVGPNSTAPFTSVIDDFELEDEPFRSKGSGAGRWLAVAVVLGGIGFAAVRFGGNARGLIAYVTSLRDPAAPGATAAAAAFVSQPPPAPSPETPPAAVAKPAATTPPAQDTRFSDDQKKALLEADKAREKAHAEKVRAAQEHRQAQAPTPRPRKPGPPVFHKGGNPHDPLNSSL
jgi:hypothetical protein